nr:interactor of constitutive active ROPs 5-like [Nicotiana tomentosiformis]
MLQRRATKALFSNIDDDKDRGWMNYFIRVRTRDIVPEEKMSFPKEWNFDRLTKDVILRPSSGKEVTKSPIPKPGKDKKRKSASQSEDPKTKPRRVRIKVIALMIDSVQKLRDEEEEEKENALAQTARPRKAVEVTKPSEPMAAAKIKPRVEEASKKNRDETIKDLHTDLAKVHEEEAELDKQVTILLIEYGLDPTVEANTSLSKLQQNVERIELLRGEVDHVKADCDRWKENIDRLAAENETTLNKLSSAEVQLRGIKKKSSAQAKRIEELETGLTEAKAVVEKTKVMADKSLAIYRADVEAAPMQIARGKVLEAEAKQFASFDDENDDEEGSRGGSDEGPEEEVAPGEEVETGRS